MIKLVGDSKVIKFTNNGCYIQDQVKLTVEGIGEQHDGLYHFKSTFSNSCLSLQKIVYSTDVWHRRLCHVPIRKLKSISGLNYERTDDMHCSICPQSRQTRLSFPDSDRISMSLFDLIHVDLWGPYKKLTMMGCIYFFTIVEDKSRSTWVYLLTQKSDAIDRLIDFFHMVFTQNQAQIKKLRTDNGQDYLSRKIQQILYS